MNISFSATKEQFRARRKFVTRRGNAEGPTWKNLKKFDVLTGVEKAQGLKKGEKVVTMDNIEVLAVNFKPIDEIIRNPVRKIPDKIRWRFPVGMILTECVLEGFPELSPEKFVEMFCEMDNCQPDTEITRILFDYTFL